VNESKTLLQHFQRDIDTGEPSILEKYVGTTYSDHHPPPFASKTPGMPGLVETFNIALGIFSDFKHVVEDQVAEGDKVASRITGTGRHVGAFLGIPPTNKMVTMSGIAIHRVANGKLVEHWGQVDAVGLLTQMGVIPPSPMPPPLPRPDIHQTSSDRALSAGEMKDKVRQLFAEGINRNNRSVLDELIDPRYVNYSMPMPTAGPEGLNQVVGMFFSAFPDMQIILEDVVAETDKAATRGHFTGTHKGTFMNVPPTGKSITTDFIDIWKAHNGRFIENWVQMDMLGMLVQLGVVPPLAP
jgi:predicted ester cyclase